MKDPKTSSKPLLITVIPAEKRAGEILPGNGKERKARAGIYPTDEPEDPAAKRQTKRRAAAYARVSTERDEQFSSYAAQVDYYTKLIKSDPELEFVRVYTDEGISGTATKNRKGFNSMISDALEGKLDIIYTKSISRFARNTVDSLIAIRKLKEAGCEVFFEKENIRTFDSGGELLITIMSSLAQEESRSISENVTWGMRKSFSDGKYFIHYREFLGYERGEDGSPVIDEAQAAIVRRIYYMALRGLSPYEIACILTEDGVKTPTGREIWYSSVVCSILHNEKYKGDALLQKTYCVSFLTKKRKVNTGELPRYYIENGHPPIVGKDLFDKVQSSLSGHTPSRFCKGDKKYSKRVKCGLCGGWYLETDKKSAINQMPIFRCGYKYRGSGCPSLYLSSEEIGSFFDTAARMIASDRKELGRSLRKLRTSKERLSARIREIAEIERYEEYFPDQRIDARLSSLRAELERAKSVNAAVSAALKTPTNKSAQQSDTVIDAAILRETVDYITFTDKNNVTVTFISGNTFSLPTG